MSQRNWNRVYIAASSKDIERVIGCKMHLSLAGITCTSRWIDEVLKTGANPPERDERVRRAESDLKDIEMSDAVWLLVPSSPMVTIGAWVELGWALHRSLFRALPVVSSGSRAVLQASVFTSLTEEFETDVDALYRILNS